MIKKKLTPSEIASLGGKAGKPENRAFFRDPVLAAEAGRKGGYMSAQKRWGWPGPGEKRKKKKSLPRRPQAPRGPQGG